MSVGRQPAWARVARPRLTVRALVSVVATATAAALLVTLAPSAARAQALFSPAARPETPADQRVWDALCRDIRAAEDDLLAGDLVAAEAGFRRTAAGAAQLSDPRARGDVRRFSLYRLTLILRRDGRDAEARQIGPEIIGFPRPNAIPEEAWFRLWFAVQDGEEARLRGEFVAAREHWRSAAPIAAADPAVRAYVLKNLAWFSDRIQDWRDELAVCRELVPLQDQLGNPEGAAEAAEWAGLCLIKLGREEEAQPFLKRAQAFWARTNVERLGGSYGALCSTYLFEVPEFDRALEFRERQLLTLATHGNMGPGNRVQVSFLMRVGTIYSRMGQEGRALEHYRAAVRTAEAEEAKGAAPDETMSARDAVVGSLRALGRLQEAEAEARAMVELWRRLGRVSQEASSSATVADILLDAGRPAEARRLFRAALDTALRNQRETDIRLDGYIDAPPYIEGLAKCEAALGHRTTALDLLRRARALRDARGTRRERAENALTVGEVYRSWGKTREALAAYRDGLTVLGPLPMGEERVRLRLLRARGDAAAALGLLDEAEAAYREATERLERARRHLLDPGRAGLLMRQAGGNVYAARAALMWRRAQGASAAKAALVMAERGRGQGMRLHVSEDAAARAGILPPGEAAQLADARRRLAAASPKALLTARPGDGPAAAALRLGEAQGRYASLRRRLLHTWPGFRQFEDPPPVTAADLSRLAKAHPDTLFLEWAVADDQTTLLFALSARDGARCFRLPAGGAALRVLVRQWRDALTGNSIRDAQTERDLARRLFSVLLAPADEAGLLAPGRHRRLVLVPDGPLLEIPFAALEDDRGRRLVERFPLSRAISLGTLCLPKPPAPAQRPAGGLLCAADPRLSASPASAAAPGSRTTPDALPAGSARSPRPLRFASREAKSICALFPGALSLTGAAMTEAAVKREMAGREILHFATHGVLDPTNGLNSHLLLSPPPGAPGSAIGAAAEAPVEPAEDGRLEAREIMAVPLPHAQMAVLSACASGQGQDVGGDGVLGFAWAFRAAGCPSVVASLWEIDDAATSRLMAVFYKGLRDGRRKDDALRDAMLALKSDPRTRRPFCWAAFDITGDPGPLRRPTTKKSSATDARSGNTVDTTVVKKK